jgi:hypothetical protein
VDVHVEIYLDDAGLGLLVSVAGTPWSVTQLDFPHIGEFETSPRAVGWQSAIAAAAKLPRQDSFFAVRVQSNDVRTDFAPVTALHANDLLLAQDCLPKQLVVLARHPLHVSHLRQKQRAASKAALCI